jgi:hypothetical protein
MDAQMILPQIGIPSASVPIPSRQFEQVEELIDTGSGYPHFFRDSTAFSRRIFSHQLTQPLGGLNGIEAQGVLVQLFARYVKPELKVRIRAANGLPSFRRARAQGRALFHCSSYKYVTTGFASAFGNLPCAWSLVILI